MPENKEGKPFKTRLFGSTVIFLFVAFVVGILGFFVWIMPSRDGFQLLGKDLPPLSDLSITEGKFVEMGHYVSRRTQYLQPKIEFQIEGETYQFRTVVGYAQNTFPFEQGHKVEVLYNPKQPENAWLKWEFARLKDEYEGISLGLIGEKLKTYYGYFSLGLLGISGLFLLINLFIPVLRWLK